MLSVTMSGLAAAQKSMDVTSNNMANAATIGFKRSFATFGDVFSNDPAANPSTAVGTGVLTNAVTRDTTAGALTSTGRATDLALDGSGYFVLQNGGSYNYSRAGSFSVDSSGYLVGTGGTKVMGFSSSDTGNTDSNGNTIFGPDTSSAVPLQVFPQLTPGSKLPDGEFVGPIQQTVPLATAAKADGSLAVAFPAIGTGPAPSPISVTVARGDSLATIASSIQAKINASTDPAIKGYAVVANGDSIQITAPNSVQTYTPVAVTGGATVFAGTVKPVADPAQGVQNTDPVVLQGLAISPTGEVRATYSNNSTYSLGFVAVATFAAPGGLRDIGNNLFAETGSSGPHRFNPAGAPKAANIMSGAIEQSNVDITGELMNMIRAQQVYNGNARILQTTVETVSRITDKL